MASHLLVVQVEDVNGDPIQSATVTVTDINSGPVVGIVSAVTLAGSPKTVFDLSSKVFLSIELTAPGYFGYKLSMKHKPGAGTYEVDARSPTWGLFSMESSGQLGVVLTLIALRVRTAPARVLSAPARDQAPPVVDDPGGIWLDGNRSMVGLFTGREPDFPAITGRNILGDPDADNWARFNTATSDVDPQRSDGGNSFHWLEYGDPTGFRMLAAVWVVNRAGSRPDRKTDFHFFFSPRTDFRTRPGGPLCFGPASVYPYQRKRWNAGCDYDPSGPIYQPYSDLAYRYLSTGRHDRGSPPGSDYAIAYQSIASGKSHIVVMPLNNLGFWGPLLCGSGLLRLAKGISAFISDRTRNSPPASSAFAGDNRQVVNRIAISGFSAGAPDTLKLFHSSTIADLVDSYRSAKSDPQAQDFAQRLSVLAPTFWHSPSRDFDRSWSEFYSVDGFMVVIATKISLQNLLPGLLKIPIASCASTLPQAG